jgi:hypothetical protein
MYIGLSDCGLSDKIFLSYWTIELSAIDQQIRNYQISDSKLKLLDYQISDFQKLFIALLGFSDTKVCYLTDRGLDCPQICGQICPRP